MGYGATIGVTLFIAIFILTLLSFRYTTSAVRPHATHQGDLMTEQTVDRPFTSSPDAAQAELSDRFKGSLHHAVLVFLLFLTFFPFFIAILTSLKSFPAAAGKFLAAGLSAAAAELCDGVERDLSLYY